VVFLFALKQRLQISRRSAEATHSNSMRPRPKPRVAVAVALRAVAELRSGAMQRDAHEYFQVAHPAPIRLSFEHAMIFDHGVDVLDATPYELKPLVPHDLARSERPTASFLCRREEAGARREVANGSCGCRCSVSW